MWAGSLDHAARVRCSDAAGLHLGPSLPILLGGNGSSRPRPHRVTSSPDHRGELDSLYSWDHSAGESEETRALAGDASVG